MVTRGARRVFSGCSVVVTPIVDRGNCRRCSLGSNFGGMFTRDLCATLTGLANVPTLSMGNIRLVTGSFGRDLLLDVTRRMGWGKV